MGGTLADMVDPVDMLEHIGILLLDLSFGRIFVKLPENIALEVTDSMIC